MRPVSRRRSPKRVAIGSTGQPLASTVTITTTTCGSNWLAAQPNSPVTNATVTVAVVTTGIAAGYLFRHGHAELFHRPGSRQSPHPGDPGREQLRGAERYTAPGFGIPPPVTQVSAPFQQQISLTSTDATNQVSYTVSVIRRGRRRVAGNRGVNKRNRLRRTWTFSIIPRRLNTPGTYTGTVVVSSPSLGSAQLMLPVTLTVTSTTTVSVTPTSLSFTQVQGGSTPAAQNLTLSATPGAATFTAVVASSTGGNWLQISPASGNANGTVQVSVQPSVANTLSQGDYPAQISFAFQGAATTSATVSVVLHVTAAQTFTASPASLGFTYQIGGAQPSAQPLSITSSGGPVAIAVAAASTGGWLSVSATSGTTPQTINVSVNPQGLTAQTYSGSVSISATGVPTLSIPVSFTVTSPPPPQPVMILNNATGAAGPIAPGEELAIKGTFLGPSSPAAGVLFSVNSSGGVSSMLAGVQVMFDNNPGTPIFVSANQINVMVPYEINGRLSTTMVVQFNGVASNPFPLSVAAAAPGLFTGNFSGTGQVAALNQNSSYNGAPGAGTAPASRGTVVSLYGTGGGQTSPISVTGSVTPIPTSASGLLNIPNVTATVGGLPAAVQFAGEAPGLVTGVFQVNVLIPAGVTPSNAVPVTIAIGDLSSPAGTTIAVQ